MIQIVTHNEITFVYCVSFKFKLIYSKTKNFIFHKTPYIFFLYSIFIFILMFFFFNKTIYLITFIKKKKSSFSTIDILIYFKFLMWL